MANLKRLQIVSFLIMLGVVLVIILLLLKPFVNILALALILTILFHPVYNFFLKRLNRPSIASLITLAIMLLIVILPLWMFGHILINELVDIYNRFRSGGFVLDRNQIIQSVPPQLQTFLQNFSEDVNGYIGRFSEGAFASISSLLSNVAAFFIGFFMLLFIVYYLLRDGHKIKEVLMDISPIASSQEQLLFTRITSAVNGVVKGAFLTALIQGVIATIGFFIFGVPEPLLWGMFTVLAALVPTVGTSLSMVPAIIYLVVTGSVPQAIGLTVWAVAAVGMIDNFVGPKLIGNSTRLHPVLVLLAVIGGIQFFGLLGFLIGPILMAIFVAMVDMYRTDFKTYLHG